MEILKIENTLRYITHTESPEHLCKGYPRSFEEKTPHNRRFITRLGNVRITAVCPCCSTEIFNKIEFKEVVYYSNLIGSRYEYNLDKWIPFNDEAPEYKKYQDLQKENIKEVVAVIDAEMDKLKNGIICPVCENHIAHDSETLSVRGDSLNSSEIGPLLNKKIRTVYWCHGEYENLRNVAIEFGKIKKEIKGKDEAEAKKKIKNLHKQCKAYRFEANNLIDTKIISKDVSNLREYIASIIKLESNERWLAERLEQLYLNEKEIERLAVREKSLKIKSKKEKVIIGEAECKKIVDQIKQLDGITMQQAGFILPPPPQKPNEPLYETPGFFNKKKVATENERKRFAYQNECTKYEQELELFEQKKINTEISFKQFVAAKCESLESELCAAKCKLETLIKESDNEIEKMPLTEFPMTQLKENITEEIKQAEKLLRDTITGKKKFYNLGIIFEKYRNMVALATFYEYLMSGRCDTLEGANGAYNIFESEIRANMIISELSEIKNSLEQIKKNQYMIYSELKNIKESLIELKEGMLDAIETIEGDLDIIAKNTEVTAFYSKVNAYYAKKNAELTNALGFLIALK